MASVESLTGGGSRLIEEYQTCENSSQNSAGCFDVILVVFVHWMPRLPVDPRSDSLEAEWEPWLGFLTPRAPRRRCSSMPSVCVLARKLSDSDR